MMWRTIVCGVWACAMATTAQAGEGAFGATITVDGQTTAEEQAIPGVVEREITVDGKTWVGRVSVVPKDGDVLVYVAVVQRKGKDKVLEERVEVVPSGGHLSLRTTVELPKKSSKPALSWEIDATWSEAIAASPLTQSTPDNWPSRRFSVIWDDAEQREDFPASSPTRQRAALPDGRRNPATEASVYRVVGPQRYALAEVESVPVVGAWSCVAGTPPAESYPLQSFVPKNDLIRVTTQPVSLDLGSGAHVMLTAGVPLVPTETPGVWTAYAAGLEVDLPLSDDAHDWMYTPSPKLELGTPAQILKLEGDGHLADTEHGAIRWGLEGPVPVFGREGVLQPMLTVRTACAEVRFPSTRLPEARP